MKAQNYSIKEILGDISGKKNYYKIPPYQREYTWGKNHLENLFNDIYENDKNYFLGSIICIENDKHTDRNEYELIDGQQRLTTISILLNTILLFINNYDEEHPEERIINLRENKKYSQLYSNIESLLVDDRKMPKLELSKQKSNDEDYKFLLHDNNLIDEIFEPKNFGNRRIARADQFFYVRLMELFKENDNNISAIFDYLEKLLSAILVKIDVEDVSSAFTLFESINNRGMPLTPIDLIKNTIIKHMFEIKKANPEKVNEKWQIIINNINDYSDQVRFLRHFYHAFKNKEEFNANFSKATKSNLIKIYEQLIKKDVELIFNNLITSSQIYKAFVSPEDIDDSHSLYKFQDKLIDLKNLGVAPSYALLLYLTQEKLVNNSSFKEILEFLEKWFVRRNLTNYPGTNKLDNIFMKLIQDLDDLKEKVNVVDFIKKILKTSDKYMSDEEFKEYLKNRDLYEENTQALKYLLIMLERSKRTRENMTNFWEVGKNNQPKWTVEHILPQNPDPKSDWKNYFSEDEIEIYKGKLGNYTLTCYNPNLSNKSFKNKLHKQDKNGNDIGLLSGNIIINKFLESCNEKWTKECIDKRTNILIEEIINLIKCTSKH